MEWNIIKYFFSQYDHIHVFMPNDDTECEGKGKNEKREEKKETMKNTIRTWLCLWTDIFEHKKWYGNRKLKKEKTWKEMTEKSVQLMVLIDILLMFRLVDSIWCSHSTNSFPIELMFSKFSIQTKCQTFFDFMLWIPVCAAEKREIFIFIGSI